MDTDFPAAHSMDVSWFAVDQDGHVAYFQSGENGTVPVKAFRAEMPPDVLQPLLARVNEPPPSPEEDDEEEEDDLWFLEPEQAARLGFFVYLGSTRVFSGPYRLCERPERPLHIDTAPPALRQGIKRVQFASLCFDQTTELTPCDHTRCEGWGPAYLSGDGRTVRPLPGREEEYRVWCRGLRQGKPDLFTQYRFEGLDE